MYFTERALLEHFYANVGIYPYPELITHNLFRANFESLHVPSWLTHGQLYQLYLSQGQVDEA